MVGIVKSNIIFPMVMIPVYLEICFWRQHERLAVECEDFFAFIGMTEKGKAFLVVVSKSLYYKGRVAKESVIYQYTKII